LPPRGCSRKGHIGAVFDRRAPDPLAQCQASDNVLSFKREVLQSYSIPLTRKRPMLLPPR
jgi:hypothetical protein